MLGVGNRNIGYRWGRKGSSKGREGGGEEGEESDTIFKPPHHNMETTIHHVSKLL